MQNLSILGSTGSIGRNALEIIEMFPERFSVKALAAKNNTTLLARQVEKFDPEIAVVFDETCALELKSILQSGSGVKIMYGQEGYKNAATHDSVDMVVTAVVGSAGLIPTIAAIDAGKNIALANKETLVMAGEIVVKRAAINNVKILPIDSEHSAIFQCIAGNRRQDLDKILLTASGGPFLNRPENEFVEIRPGSNEPESFILLTLLSSDSNRSPTCPATPMERKSKILKPHGKSGKKKILNKAPAHTFTASPPTEPSTVLFGLTAGQSLCFPKYDPV